MSTTREALERELGRALARYGQLRQQCSGSNRDVPALRVLSGKIITLRVLIKEQGS